MEQTDPHKYRGTQETRNQRGMVSKSLSLFVFNYLFLSPFSFKKSIILAPHEKKLKDFSKTPNKIWHQFRTLQRG
jgi:hypothetical protein